MDNRKKKILLTGANGFLGGKITKCLLETTGYTVVTAAADAGRVGAMLAREDIRDTGRVEFLANEELLKEETDLRGVFCAVHLAFSRRFRPAADIAASIDLAQAVFVKLARTGVRRVINMSSQSVYGNAEDFRTEDTVPAPEYPYAVAKYAAEVIFKTCMGQTDAQFTSLRLDPVAQSQKVVRALCRNAREGKIQLRGGKQLFSFIDADDAARAVVAMVQSPDGWERVYNVGWNRRRYTLVELADLVAQAAEEQGYGRPVVELDESEDIRLWEGMDSSRFMSHTGWRPQTGLCDMIRGMMREDSCERQSSQ